MMLLCSELNEIASKYTRMLLLIKIQIVQPQNMCNIFHGSKGGVYELLEYQLLYQAIDWAVDKSPFIDVWELQEWAFPYCSCIKSRPAPMVQLSNHTGNCCWFKWWAVTDLALPETWGWWSCMRHVKEQVGGRQAGNWATLSCGCWELLLCLCHVVEGVKETWLSADDLWCLEWQGLCWGL